MKNKKWLWILLAVVVLAAAFLLLGPKNAAMTEGNLLKNASFDETDEDGLPLSWYTEAYVTTPGFTVYSADENDGGFAAHISNLGLNDARFVQTVSVAPDTLYCFSGKIKAQATDGKGANLSIEGIYLFSESVYDSGDGWQTVYLYGRTGPKQTAVTVFARLGGYSGEAVGDAWFDDLCLEHVESVPSGYYTSYWYDVTETEVSEETSSQGSSWPLILAISIIFALLCIPAARYMARHEEDKIEKQSDRHYYDLLFIAGGLALAFIMRVIVSVTVSGYGVDIGCFQGWAGAMASQGPAQFYVNVFIDKTQFCDYPPGFLLLLWPFGLIAKAMGGTVSETALKMIPNVFDILTALVLYKMAKKHMSPRSAAVLALLYAFNPLTVLTGAGWGQMDSISAFTMLLVVSLAIEGKWHYALPVYVLSVLLKPQALMFGPMGLAALVNDMVRHFDKVKLKRVLIGVGVSLVTALVIVVPFAVHLPLWADETEGFWLFTLYRRTMSYYDRATVNATNLYFLFGKNWTPVTEIMAKRVAILAGGMLSASGALLLFGKKRDKTDRITAYAVIASGVLCALVGVIFNVTYAFFGTMMMVVCFLFTLWQYIRKNDLKAMPLFGAILLIAFYAVGVMMHERYLFTALILLFVAYVFNRDRRILMLAVATSAAVFVNVACALDGATRVGGVDGHLDAPTFGIQSASAGLCYLNAAIICVLAVYALYVGFAMSSKGDTPLPVGQEKKAKPDEKSEETPEEMPAAPALSSFTHPYEERKMQKTDWLLMLGVTVLYAVLAFTNLGSMKAPQNGWTMLQQGEYAVLDLGETKTFEMAYYGGIHATPSHFKVELSDDNLSYDEIEYGEMNEGDCFTWKYLTSSSEYNEKITFGSKITVTARYVKISARIIGTNLFEVIFRDPETKQVLPVTLLEQSGTGAEHLIDEQDTLEGEPGWFNSMYFDEIYHARTAYEHLHGLSVYETSHPPLGKVIMSWCIGIFGMTPFGWRFAGTLMGVAMLPGMYLLGKLLTKRRWAAFGAMLLMAVDCMHFTQTRIATIDSFIVLFIIWQYYFMFRYALMDYWHKPLHKSLVWLGLSGLFMGLGFASKWTGAYAGVGLAVIFFWTLYRRVREGMAGKIEIKEIIRRVWVTLLCCALFFVLVPCVIYYCAYIPYFASSGGVTVKKVIQAAVGRYFETGVVGGMLGYHSTPGLGMDHYFYSPWYQWPLSLKPMWYASNNYTAEGMASTIMAMGNPAVWWAGILSLVLIVGVWVRRHYSRSLRTVTFHTKENDIRPALLIIAFFAQYLPWMLVPRGTYIYHYFTDVPFIILCTVVMLDMGAEKLDEKVFRRFSYAYYAAAAVVFVLFFPYASGITVPTWWLDAMKWFPNWLFY